MNSKFEVKYENLERFNKRYTDELTKNHQIRDEATKMRHFLNIYTLVECNLHFHLNKDQDTFLVILLQRWEKYEELFKKYEPELTEELFEYFKNCFYRAYVRSIFCREYGMYYFHISFEDIEKVYKLANKQWFPNLEEEYSAILCYYIAKFYKKECEDNSYSTWFEKGSKLVEDENHIYCLGELARFHSDLKMMKLALNRGNLFSLYYLLQNSENPKYNLMTLDIYNNRKIDILGCKPEHPNYPILKDYLEFEISSYVNYTRDYIPISELKEYSELVEKFKGLLDKVSQEPVLLEKYNISQLFEKNEIIERYEEETREYNENMIEYYNGLKEVMDTRPVDQKKRDEYIEKFAELANYLKLQFPIYYKRSYFEYLYVVYKLKKNIPKLEEEIKYLPGSGELYLEGEKRFYSN